MHRDEEQPMDVDGSGGLGAAATESSSSASSLGAAAGAAAAAAVTDDRSADWRPAIRHEYESSSVSGTRPIVARRFDTLTPQQYQQQYASQRGAAAAAAAASGAAGASASVPFDRGVPIVFDNGSYELRGGFSTDAEPRLSYRSLVGRPRNRREGDFVLCGNQLIEADQYAPQRIKVRSPFEQTLVTHYDLMEYLFDYSFASLGLRESVPHPVFVTEPLCNPNYCRAKMSELLLECYAVEGVAYGVSEMCVWRYNNEADRREQQQSSEGSSHMDGDCTGDALVVQCGYESSSVVPIVESQAVFAHSARLSVGGAQLAAHLTHSLIHIEQPQHQQHFNTHRVQELVEQYCEMVPDCYDERMRSMALLYDVNGHSVPTRVPADSDVLPPVVLQLPFAQSVSTAPSEAELAARVERKEVQRQRLRTLMAERKEKKLVEDQETLADWERVRADFQAKLLTPSEYLRQLKRRTFESEQEFLQHYDKMKKSIEQRLSGGDKADDAPAPPAETKTDEQLYPLLSRPDADLTADELKEKVKQKRLKGSADVQAARRREKGQRLLAEKQSREMEAQEYAANPQAFLASLHRARDTIVQSREERVKAESDSTGRRSVAAKKRASLLAAMGGSGGSIESIEKNARKDRQAFQKEAAFGMRDEDWKIYEDVRMPGEAMRNDSEDERDAISKIDAKIAQYDPTYGASLSKSASAPDRAEAHQVALWVDRVRLPEFFWQPAALMGIDESGLGEIMRRVLVRLEAKQASSVVKNVLLCGGSTLFPGFLPRLTYELRQLRPTGAPIRVRHARDPQLDAWKGAASVCNSLFLTRAEWEEQGSDYIKENAVSNRFIPTAPDETPEAARKRKR